MIENENITFSDVAIRISPKKNKGICFTFSRFIDTLIKLSYLYVRRSEELMS